MPKDAHGLVVEDVNPDGRAADAGLQAGDVIEEVNRQPVKSVDELQRRAEEVDRQAHAAADPASGQRPLRDGEACQWLMADC